PAPGGPLRRLVEADSKARGRRPAGIAAARERFYRGDVAATIGGISERVGGLLRASDLAGYRAQLEAPLRTTFAGREILGQSAWTQGPVLMQALGMLSTFDLRALGHNSARYIHVVTEALKLAFADREQYYGDREDALGSIGDLLVPAYLQDRAALIRHDRAAAEAPAPGDPRRRGVARGAGATAGVRASGVSTAAADGTTHIAAIDREGNMICLTPSGGVFRKSAFAPELGCTLSTRSEMFVLEDDHPNGLVPSKRPRTTLVSYLICEGGVPTMTIGCPGGDDQSQADLQLVLNLLVFGMNPQQAVEAPRFSTQTLVNSFYPRVYRPGQLNVEPAVPGRPRGEPASTARVARSSGERCPRRDRSRRVARRRGSGDPRGRRPPGIGRASVHHGRRVSARLVAHRFPARLRRRRDLHPELRGEVRGGRRAAAPHEGDREDPALAAEHARPLRVPQVGHHAHGQVLSAVAGHAARPWRPADAQGHLSGPRRVLVGSHRRVPGGDPGAVRSRLHVSPDRRHYRGDDVRSEGSRAGQEA